MHESHQQQDSSIWRRRGVRALLVIAAVLAVLLLLVMVGSFLPSVPILGLVGAGLSGLTGWITIITALAVVLAVFLWFRVRNVTRAIFVGVTALSLIGSVIITAQLVTVSNVYGSGANPFALPEKAATPDQTVTYTRHDGKPIKMAVWKPKGETAKGGAPVALFVHGGGWVLGNELANSGDKQWFADHGWLVLSATYSISSETHHYWDVNYNQITCAMVWAGKHAAQYGGNISKFAMLGDSAGGNLAISAAYQGNAGKATPTCEGEVPKVDAVATVYPAVDPTSFYDNADPLMRSSARTDTTSWIGGTPKQFPARYKAATSSTYITPDAPATLVVAAEHDHLVPKAGAQRFVDDAKDRGVDVTRIGVPYAEHVFDLFPYGKQLYLSITYNWLEQQGLTR